MAVTITDHRTIWNEADATTGWTGATTLFTADPDPIEATGCLGAVVSTTTLDGYFTGTATSLTAKLVYAWTFPRGAMDSVANGGMSVYVGDGTNGMAYHRAGKDLSAFTHLEGPVGWQCLVLDQSNLPTAKTTRTGSEGALNWGAITRIGVTWKTLAKSVGGVSNCFVDIIRVADLTLNNGCVLSVAGGTVGDPGTFEQIAIADATITNQQAFGVVRKLGTGLYGVQGPIQFGNATGTASSYFADTNAAVVFESRGLATTRYKIFITDNGVGTTVFRLGTKVGTGTEATGASGCTITVPAGVGGEWDSQTDTDVTDVFLYGSTFTGFTNGFKMRTNQEFIGNKLTASGEFTPAGALVYNSEISASTSTYAMTITNSLDMDNVVNCTFSNNNRAIRITTAGTYSFIGHQFANNTFQVDFTGTGTCTINPSAGCNVSQANVTASGGGTITVNTPSVNLTFSGVVNNSEIRIIRVSDQVELGGVENTTGGQWVFSHTLGGTVVDIYVLHLNYQWLAIRNYTLLAVDASIPVQQILDRQYDPGTV